MLFPFLVFPTQILSPFSPPSASMMKLPHLPIQSCLSSLTLAFPYTGSSSLYLDEGLPSQ